MQCWDELTHRAISCFHSVSQADDFSRWFQGDVSSAGRGGRTASRTDKYSHRDGVSNYMIQELCIVSYRCVVPLLRQVFWLGWVGHPRRATVRRWRWHDKIVRVTWTVGWYSIHCCYWISCKYVKTDTLNYSAHISLLSWLMSAIQHPTTLYVLPE